MEKLPQELQTEERLNTQLNASQFVAYQESLESFKRSEVLTLLLNTRAFWSSKNNAPLPHATVTLMVQHMTSANNPEATDEQKQEAAILTMRFVYRYLKEHGEGHHCGDIISALVGKF